MRPIERLRLDAGQTITEVALATGIARNTIARAERGRGTISDATLIALAGHYGIPASDLAQLERDHDDQLAAA